MRASSLLVSLCGTILPALALVASPSPVGSALVTRDEDIVATYERIGMCFMYVSTKRPSWTGAEQFPCIKYCKDTENSDYSECDTSGYRENSPDTDFNNLPTDQYGVMSVLYDSDKNPYLPAPCKCSNPAVEELVTEIVSAVAEGLSMLDNVLCAVGLSVFQTIADVGLMAIPGGGEVWGAARAAVSGAKTFAENALDAASYNDWIGKTCNLPDFHFDIFAILTSGPDSMGTSVGCKRKNKAGCKDPPKGSELPTTKPAPPKTTDTPDKTTDNAPSPTDPPKSDAPATSNGAQTSDPPKSSDGPTSSAVESSAAQSSSSASACQAKSKRSVPMPTAAPRVQQLTQRAAFPGDWTDDNTAECNSGMLEVQVAEDQLASGSNGRIFKAIDHDGKLYAIKTSEKDAELKSEYKFMKTTIGDNPNIIKVYSQCVFGIVGSFLMELGDGGDLDAQMTARVYVDNEALTKTVMGQVLAGVSYAHSKGIAHNDLKGGNVLFVGGVAKIIDFGEATSEATVSKIDSAGGIRGPEAETGSSTSIDTKLNDVWSLGVLMVNMLIGKKPWTDASAGNARAIWEKPNTAALRSDACKNEWKQFTKEFCDVLATVFQPQDGRKDAAAFMAAIANPSLKLIDDCA